MKRWITGALALVAFVLPTTGQAADVALIIANRFYDSVADAPQARALEGLAPELEAAGYDVMLHVDVDSDDFTRIASETERRLSAGDRLLIVLGGHVVQTPRDGFLLLSDVGPVTSLLVGASGVSIGALLDIASAAPGPAVVAIGDSRWPITTGDGVSDGYLPSSLPDRVTVVTGVPNLLARFVSGELLQPGRTVGQAAAAAAVAGVQVYGARPAQPMRPATAGGLPSEVDVWARAQTLDTVEAYGVYLRRFPDGRFAAEARARLDALTETPAERAERLEAELGLGPEQRRDVQRNLQTLGHYDRGIDGLFGPGTRAGISAWQAGNGMVVTGFVTANQIALLSQQAAARTAELRAERERQDRQYWADTGQGRDEAGLRAYLERFPDGIYAELANQRLAAIQAERQAAAEAADRAAWQRARAADTLPAYRRYIEEFPAGLFLEEAEAALDRLDTDRVGEAERLRAMQEEQGLNLVPTGRRLIEVRLQMLGFEPGPIDGVFDPRSRAAIRRYQEDRGLPPTGFISQQTLVRLLAEAVLR